MDLTEGLLPPRVPPVETTIRFSTGSKAFKGEDTMFCRQNEAVGDEGVEWSVFMVCDGHCGSEAADYVAKSMWSILKEKLPTCAPPTRDGADCIRWASVVSKSIKSTFLQLNEDFCQDNTMAGTTVTLALICGWTLTIANVGDSDAVLDTLNRQMEISVSDRLSGNEDEKHRLRNAGISLGKLSQCLSKSSGSEKEGLGPVRCWPGGLANSRSIGDKHAGEEIIAMPHVQHFFLPKQGCRLVVASDGLWDVVKLTNAINLIRLSPTELAADRGTAPVEPVEHSLDVVTAFDDADVQTQPFTL